MPIWDATLYLQFADERTRPSRDLIARIPLENPGRIVDLGCGPGNSTEQVRRRWPHAEIEGIDNAPQMLDAAARAYPAARWTLGDIAHWTPDVPVDLAFANAALQWLPGHQSLFPRLLGRVAPGGVLAAQLPSNFASPYHQQLRLVADDPEWRHLLVGARQALTVESPSFYYDVLQPLSSHLDIWMTEYVHLMSEAAGIVEFMRGTGLRPYLEALETEVQRARFLDRLRARVREAYAPQADGRVLFLFRRLFIVAARAAG
jgi:trans-aconitate 2-methyltransferase